MKRHFETELEELKKNLIKMSSLVEESIKKSVSAVLNRDLQLAESVINDDYKINQFEVKIETEIEQLLALQTPVATDLRFVLSSVKINNELERIGDHAVNIAQSALYFSKKKIPPSSVEELTGICNLTREMLKDAIDSLIQLDIVKGESILYKDDMVDNYNKKIIADCIELIKDNPNKVVDAMELIRISRNLERVADLTTNIAEDVIFIINAKNVKHHQSDFNTQQQ